MSTALEHARPVAAPGRLGQGTAVEQSRAVAEVQAQVVVAQQFPRSVTAAVAAMEEAARQPALANRAFFRFPRGQETVAGPSIHLARELARCWGNIQYGITELRRDDAAGQSEMMAWAWDVQTNTRDSNTFIVPHVRDTKNGPRVLADQRDIYENNANAGARRLREAIFAQLPVWFREQAIAICTQTIENGGGKPLAQRIAQAVRVFEAYRVTPGRIAAKYGHRTVDDLTAVDVGQLTVVYESLRQGTVTVDDEFPPEPDRVTAADVLASDDQAEGKPAAKRARKPKAAPEPPAEALAAAADSPVEWPEWATEAHLAQCKRLDIGPDILSRAMQALAQGDTDRLTGVLADYTAAETLIAAIDGQGAGE